MNEASMNVNKMTSNEIYPLHEVLDKAEMDKALLQDEINDTWRIIEDLRDRLLPILIAKAERPPISESIKPPLKPSSEMGIRIEQITNVDFAISNLRAMREFINNIRSFVDL